MNVRRSSCTFFLVLASIAVARNAAAADPTKPGPYRVGVRTEVFVDADRTCAITQKPRTLVTEIWYPATDNADDFPQNQFNDFFGREEGRLMASAAMLRFGAQFDKLNDTFKNIARRNAPARDGKFPLLVFSHGNGGFRHQNTFQAEYLASHGYIVAAPDHTGNAALTILPDQIIIYNSLTRSPERRDDRPHDLSFLLTHLARLAAEEGHWLHGRLAPDQVGAFGHSFGGFTVCRAVELDARIKAILPMTLAGTLAESADAKPCPVPLLVILGDKDRTVKEIGNERSIAYFERAAGPKYLLNFKDAGHFTFTEMTQINPNFGDGIGVEKDDEGNVKLKFSDAREDQRITNEYSVAFFDAFLRNDASARKFIDTNHAPEELAYRKE
jgi:predicted dienelactone hydrolase